MFQKIVLPGGIPLFMYGFMILIGFLLASFLCRREAEKRGLPKDKIMDFAVFLILAGIVGARVFYVVQFWDDYFAEAPWYKVLAIYEGGLVFYGGFIAAFLTGAWYLWHNKLPVLDVLDTCTPFLPVGMAFGRLGCWLNGCCWGWRCSDYLPDFVNRFPESAPAYQHQAALGYIAAGADRALAVQPTQLFDAAHSFVLFLLLWWNLRQSHPKGVVTFLMVAMYGTGRFVIEVLRGDHQIMYDHLTVSQTISLLTLGIGLTGLFGMMKNRKKTLSPAK